MILAILQARVSSTRLPGKVLRPLLGEPMLARQIERLRRCRRIDRLVVATSDQPDDDAIAQLCVGLAIGCARGSLNDVLERFHAASSPYNAEHIVRLTGDCPLADPSVIDACVDFHLAGDFDYTTNALEPSFPDGLDVEVFRARCLDEAWHEATLPSQREHVTPFLYTHPERYRIGHFRGDAELSHLRWTVDEPVDFALVETIFGELYPANPAFTTADILALLARRPELTTLNIGIDRNEGYAKSLAADASASTKV